MDRRFSLFFAMKVRHHSFIWNLNEKYKDRFLMLWSLYATTTAGATSKRVPGTAVKIILGWYATCRLIQWICLSVGSHLNELFWVLAIMISYLAIHVVQIQSRYDTSCAVILCYPDTWTSKFLYLESWEVHPHKYSCIKLLNYFFIMKFFEF